MLVDRPFTGTVSASSTVVRHEVDSTSALVCFLSLARLTAALSPVIAPQIPFPSMLWFAVASALCLGLSCPDPAQRLVVAALGWGSNSLPCDSLTCAVDRCSLVVAQDRRQFGGDEAVAAFGRGGRTTWRRLQPAGSCGVTAPSLVDCKVVLQRYLLTGGPNAGRSWALPSD